MRTFIRTVTLVAAVALPAAAQLAQPTFVRPYKSALIKPAELQAKSVASVAAYTSGVQDMTSFEAMQVRVAGTGSCTVTPVQYNVVYLAPYVKLTLQRTAAPATQIVVTDAGETSAAFLESSSPNAVYVLPSAWNTCTSVSVTYVGLPFAQPTTPAPLNNGATVASGTPVGVGIVGGLDTTSGTVVRAFHTDSSGNLRTTLAGSMPLPTGAATEAKQDTGNASLSSIDSKLTSTTATSALQTAGNSTLTSILARLPATLGQKAMTASLPITIASDQSALSVRSSLAGGTAISTGTVNNTAGDAGLVIGAANDNALGTAFTSGVHYVSRKGSTSGTGVSLTVCSGSSTVRVVNVGLVDVVCSFQSLTYTAGAPDAFAFVLRKTSGATINGADGGSLELTVVDSTNNALQCGPATVGGSACSSSTDTDCWRLAVSSVCE